ncbi:hypothetical protein Tco_0325043 [Tanacetum coccineum]
MAWLPMCGELRSASNSVHWEPMFILYCQRSVCEDYRLAGLINRAATEVNDTIMVRDQFLEELDNLVAEMELNARKKDEFIQKLKGLMPY